MCWRRSRARMARGLLLIAATLTTAGCATTTPSAATRGACGAFRPISWAVEDTDATLRQELWDWLDKVVDWFNTEYVWDHTGGAIIPACWPLHPHLVHEIASLADQRRRAGLDPTSSALEEWHRFGIPGFLERLKTRTKNSCDEHHAHWPAEARYARGDSEEPASDREQLFDADISSSGPHQAVPRMKPPARRVMRRPDGELVDPDTGEVL